MSLINANEARKNAESFDLTAAQVLDEIGSTIKACSKIGKNSATCSFLRSAVNEQELEIVKSTLIEKGYVLSYPIDTDKEIYIKVEY